MRNKQLKKKGENKIKTREWRTRTGFRKGVKVVHIGNDVWRCGRQNYIIRPDDSKPTYHMVIYGPNREEYHVWGQDVYDMCSVINEYDEIVPTNTNRHGNGAIESKLKIYILTHILDKKENWCFDLTKIPSIGPLKVICANGTVKNIDFDGSFKPLELVSKRHTFPESKNWWYGTQYAYTSRRFIEPVGYRLK